MTGVMVFGDECDGVYNVRLVDDKSSARPAGRSGGTVYVHRSASKQASERRGGVVETLRGPRVYPTTTSDEAQISRDIDFYNAAASRRSHGGRPVTPRRLLVVERLFDATGARPAGRLSAAAAASPTCRPPSHVTYVRKKRRRRRRRDN